MATLRPLSSSFRAGSAMRSEPDDALALEAQPLIPNSVSAQKHVPSRAVLPSPGSLLEQQRQISTSAVNFVQMHVVSDCLYGCHLHRRHPADHARMRPISVMHHAPPDFPQGQPNARRALVAVLQLIGCSHALMAPYLQGLFVFACIMWASECIPLYATSLAMPILIVGLQARPADVL